MSLGDHLRYLRAMRGGIDTGTIANSIGLEKPWPINEIEVRYRQVGDDELVAKLAEFYQRPLDEFLWHRERSRKKLTLEVHEVINNGESISLTLRSGEKLIGKPQWWDLGVIGLIQEGDREITVVQRHAVVDWESGSKGT